MTYFGTVRRKGERKSKNGGVSLNLLKRISSFVIFSFAIAALCADMTDLQAKTLFNGLSYVSRKILTNPPTPIWITGIMGLLLMIAASVRQAMKDPETLNQFHAWIRENRRICCILPAYIELERRGKRDKPIPIYVGHRCYIFLLIVWVVATACDLRFNKKD